MRKLIYSTNITLDGFIDHDAVIADDELHDISSDLLSTGDVILFGRVAYELLADYWPSAPTDKALPASMRRFANTINSTPKIVYTRTMKNVQWNTKIEREVDPERIMAMKAQPGRNILLAGGASIARTFMNIAS